MLAPNLTLAIGLKLCSLLRIYLEGNLGAPAGDSSEPGLGTLKISSSVTAYNHPKQIPPNLHKKGIELNFSFVVMKVKIMIT